MNQALADMLFIQAGIAAIVIVVAMALLGEIFRR